MERKNLNEVFPCRCSVATLRDPLEGNLFNTAKIAPKSGPVYSYNLEGGPLFFFLFSPLGRSGEEVYRWSDIHTEGKKLKYHLRSLKSGCWKHIAT